MVVDSGGVGTPTKFRIYFEVVSSTSVWRKYVWCGSDIARPSSGMDRYLVFLHT